MVKKKRPIKAKASNKEIVVITQKGCQACEEMRRKVHNVRYMDLADSSEAVRIADKLGITAIPTVLQRDKKTGKVCVLDNNLKPIKCFIPKR